MIEAGKAFGSTDRQMLLEIQIPLALPTIMAGLNQTLMLSLSMVVIVALIGGGGLGQEIYSAVTSMDIGRAGTSGLAVLVLAIVLDRISQVRGVDRSAV
jgi:glycine betaine/proline transport system permease protein